MERCVFPDLEYGAVFFTSLSSSGGNAGKLARGFGSFGGWSVLLLRMPSGACRLECRLRMPSGVVLLRMPSGVVLCGPYPTPRLGIAAPQAVSNLFGCGVGEPTSHSDAGSVMGVYVWVGGVNACPGSCIRRPGSELCQKCYITSWCPLPTPGYTEKRTEAITMRVFSRSTYIFMLGEARENR